MDKNIAVIVISVLVLFGLIVLLTGAVGTYFGKTAEMAMLVIVAIVLLIILLSGRNKKE